MKTEDISKNQVSPTGPAPYVLDVNTERLLQMADGYKLSGLFDEARAICVTISEDDPNWEHAQFLLLGLDLSQERMTDAANRGLAVLSKGGSSKAMVLFAAMAVHQSGDPNKAL